MDISKQEIRQIFLDVLEENGLIKPYITRAQIIEQIGRNRYERAVKSGLITRQKRSGRNSAVRVSRKEFTAAITSGKI